MARYAYLAKDADGKSYKGSIEAYNEAELTEKLKDMGFYPTSVKREKGLIIFGAKRVSPQELVVFSRQLSTMVGAGLTLNKSLEALEKQTDSSYLKIIISEIRINIEGGVSLSKAMEKHKAVFSDFFVGMVEAGESGGVLKKVLERLADHLEKQEALKRSVRGAFAYPVVVGTLAVLVVGFLVIFIVPVFKSVYDRMHLSLPLPTLLLIGASNCARKFWWLIILLLSGLGFFYKTINKTVKFRNYFDKSKMNIPIFGKLVCKATVARFIRTFGDMVTSGVGVIDSLKIADKVAENSVISKITNAMIDSVRRGGLISEPLQKQNIFPAGVVQMISTGEESGKLGYMLEKSAEGLDQEVDDVVKRLVVKIEPLLTFLMAFLVGTIAVAIYLPIFDVIKEMSAR